MVCDSFLGDKFDLPESKEEIGHKLKKVNSNVENIYNTLQFTLDNFKKYLASIHESKNLSGYSQIKVYYQYLKKSRLIFHTLNKLKLDNSLLIGLFWVP
jgi:vacuolar-type H+-ATPase subunit I/STV1